MQATRAPRACRRFGIAAPLLLVLTCGCGDTDENGAARRTAETFADALRDANGVSACRLLAPSAQSSVEETTGRPCAEAVVGEVDGDPGAITAAAVFGTAAQVELERDTVFLAQYDGGWRVLAAGCRSRGEHPYDCRIDGG